MSVAFFSDHAAAPSVYVFTNFRAQFYLQLLISNHLFPVFDRQTGVHAVKQQATVIVALYPSVPINAFYSKIKPKSDYPLKTLYPRAFQTGQNRLVYYDFTTVG